MASYAQPSAKFNGVYNSGYFVGREDETLNTGGAGAVQVTGDYVKLDGSTVMTGRLTVPDVVLFNGGSIRFDDNTEQNTAFTSSHNTDINTSTEKLTNIARSGSNTIISGALQVRTVVFLDDGSAEQTAAFQQSHIDDIADSKQKLTNSTFNSQTGVLTISNLHATVLTSGTFNSTHLTGTTSNLQTQINEKPSALRVETVEGKTQHQSADLTKTTFVNDVKIPRLEFSDSTLQTTAFSTSKSELLDIVNGRTSYITSISSPNPTTVIHGHLYTNHVSLFDANGVPASITFPDASVQLSAFSTAKSDLLNTVNSRTANTSTYQITGEPPATAIVGNLDTNFLNLVGNYGYEGRILFPDSTYQHTAFTNEKNNALSSLSNTLQNITTDGNVTQFDNAILCDEIYLNDGGFIDFVHGRQYSAYTAQDKDKLGLLSISSEGISVNKVTFPDNSFMTSAFTIEKDALLSSATSQVNTLAQKTVGLSNPNSLTVNGSVLTIPSISTTSITFSPSSVQNFAYTNADRTRVQASMASSLKSSVNEYVLAVNLPLSNNSFISGTSNKALYAMTDSGLYILNGTLSVLDMNSVQLMRFRVRDAVGNQSPYVGINFDSGDDNYGNFQMSMSWVFSVPINGQIYIDIHYNYRTNPGSTSAFNYQILKLL